MDGKQYQEAYSFGENSTGSEVSTNSINRNRMIKIASIDTMPLLKIAESEAITKHYTPESWLDGKKSVKVEGTVDGYYYSINSQTEEGAPYVTLENTRAYKLLFDNVEFGSGAAYWLASRGVLADSGHAVFGPGVVGEEDGVVSAGTCSMFYSDGLEYEDFAGVRPVVYLKSGITENEVPKIGDKEETPWNYSGGGSEEA